MGKKKEETAMNALLVVVYGVLLWVASLILRSISG